VQAEPIREALARWSQTAIPVLRDARPELPDVLGDRAADVWEPLLAIADLAGGPWPDRARRAAKALVGEASDEDIRVELLHDIHTLFIESEPNTAFIASGDLVTKLCGLEDRPWASWRNGKALSGHGRARLLKPFGVVPVQNTERTARRETG
jgi:putative DNA primase/helicase